MVRLFGRDPVRKKIERQIIREAVAKEKVKQRLLKFEKRKARAIERVRKPSPFKGIAVKAGKRARKEIGKSIRGFAQKIGKPREEEKETLVILGGKPRRVKGRVRIIQPVDSALDLGDLGLNVDILGKQPRKTKQKPFRFF
ncbi:hypothetical protein LCGC14_0714750 [marine sediment metagenome]|uniref:Uncharacterized protein n=1 Tax=marine sediment metagenome TaxID=412755 RepID=A0A0F9QE25_9ZZZZ